MAKIDREVLELCKLWFEDIMERSDRLTTGNVSHGRRAIHGTAKNHAVFVDKYLQDTWKPSDEQMNALNDVISSRDIKYDVLSELWTDLKKLREEQL